MLPVSVNGESSSLNVNAMEFSPSSRSNSQVIETEGPSSSYRNTGAVPKNSNRRNNQFRHKKNSNDAQKSWRNNYQNFERNRNTGYSRRNTDNDTNEAYGNEDVEEKTERKFYRNNLYHNERRQKWDNKSAEYTRFKITIKPETINGADKKSVDDDKQLKTNEKSRDKDSQKRQPFRSKKPGNKVSISQREQLMNEIERNILECMICCDKIKAYHPIWACNYCFHILHLQCIKKWMKKSADEFGLRCPACNQISKNTPGDYLCFCGKLKNPQVNRNDLPHSCGNMCLSTANCQHPCNLLCHPGPHETCHATVDKFCGCGKTSKVYQCSMKATFECEAVCDKILNCGIHRCTQKCHQDNCPNCLLEIESSCYCEKESMKLQCTVENHGKVKYSCEKECGKSLDCGNHKCLAKCHAGECKPCKLMPEFVKTCPCGKMTLKNERKSCSDPIQLCQSTCEKKLKCGLLSSPHSCVLKCHLGNCLCNQKTSIKCRCGRKEEKIPCKDLLDSDLRCKKKCNKFKSCGRHKCNNECCIDIEHICMQNCNRTLDCKKHKCQKNCHVGNCPPCHRMSFEELKCECGFTVIYPPVHCGTTIKDCSNKCTRNHVCNHPVSHNCHSDPQCPPCVFLTSKFCYGKHEERKTIPCNQDSFSCGMPCAKLLKCERHKCIKICHADICEKFDEVCTQKCTIKRKECEHNCNLKCHDGECPDNVSCRERIQVTCQCGNLKGIKTCEQVEYENRKLQRIRLTSQQNDEASTLSEMLGDFKKTIKILDCNDECKTIERNRRLDIAFKVQNPTLAATPKFTPTYSDHVRSFYKKDPGFVNMVHEKLTELVKLAKETKTAPYRCHSFPSMNKDKRHVIHDMAELFGVETKAFDAEPNRNIVATAVREYCWLPSMSIAEIIQRENGARRPPMSQLFKK